MENINRDEQLYTIPLNDQNYNLYVKVVDGRISYRLDESINFLMPVIKVIQNNDSIDIYLFSKKCFSIHDGKIIQHTNFITSTEMRNIGEMIRNDGSAVHTKNEVYFTRMGLLNDEGVKTELHTHLIEILDSGSFLNFVERLNGCVKVNDKGLIDFSFGVDYSVGQIKMLPQLYNFVISQLEMPVDRVGNFDELEKKVANRTGILLDIVSTFSSTSGLDDLKSARVLVTKLLLHDSLVYLRNCGVKYTEISYSNINVISDILNSLDDEFYNDISGIDFRFLVSSSRLKPAKDFRQSSRNLDNNLSNNGIIGFDFMGLESKFSEADLNNEYKDSLYNKLRPIIHILSKSSNSVLRLHSGEFVNTDMNTEQLLETIAFIEEVLLIKIPPPEIRIGHGIHIVKSPRLIELIKRFDCIVEINASSNFALHNVELLKEIPYKFYLDNGIKVVLSTDGGGFYRTTSTQEKYIAQAFTSGDALAEIMASDEVLYQQKIGGMMDHERNVRR